MKLTAKRKTLLTLWLLLSTLSLPRIASADLAAETKTRVGGLDLSEQTRVEGSTTLSPRTHQGFSHGYGKIASDYLVAAEGVGAAGVRGVGTSFFDGSFYGPKVLGQMVQGAGEFHSFPEAVTAFESTGVTSQIVGGDGITRQMLEIPGSYATSNGTWYQGVFQFIKDVSGEITHRLFVPWP